MLYYHIITFGCQMNKSDSERASTLLEKMGFIWADTPDDADFVLLNTCSVRQKAEDRVVGFARNIGKQKSKNQKLKIAIMGCMPGRDTRKKLSKQMPSVDIFFPTNELTLLPSRLAPLYPELLDEIDTPADYLHIYPQTSSSFQAFVPIMTGCDNYCSYCVVPRARGRERSRSVADILDEIKKLVADGCIFVTLLGQNVNSYKASADEYNHKNPYKDTFAGLLWEINQIDGLKWIHYTSPHPYDMTDEVIDAMTLAKHINFLHLPVQSGSDRILQKMNRDYTAKDYIDLVKKVRKKIPDIAMATDIIVGFCTETDDDFAKTMSLYRDCDFDISYNAQYSMRSGTLAERWVDDVDQKTKKQRWQKLQEIMEKTTLKKNQKYIDEIVEVLVEEYRLGVCRGVSKDMKVVEFAGDKDILGKIVKIQIESALEWILKGKIVQKNCTQ